MSDETVIYTAEEAAGILKCTANWLKEKARTRKIPFTMVGGGYRWTPAQLAEIVRSREVRPGVHLAPRVPRRQRDDGAVTALRARTPKRKRGAA